jgi:hypothetical protein
MLVKLPVFCLVACVRMRYFTCAHQPTLTGVRDVAGAVCHRLTGTREFERSGARITGATEPV